MRHLARTLAALAIGTACVFASGLPASAADPSCPQQDNSYGASTVCVVNVLAADPICPAGALQLSYKVTAEGTDATTVDLHWLNPGGTDVVQTGQPFTGTVAWPASIPKKTTNVQFVVGAEAAVSVDPSVALEKCLTSGSKVLAVSNPTSGSEVLALTGANVLPYAAAAGGLLVAGTALLLFRSARTRRSTSATH